MAKKSDVSSITCIVNKRNGEIHKRNCIWVDFMLKKNKLYCGSVLEAQSLGYNNSCMHCFKDYEKEPDATPDSRLSLKITNKSMNIARGDVVKLLAKKRNLEGESIPIQFWGTIYSGNFELLGTSNTDSNGEARFDFKIPMDTPSGEGLFRAYTPDNGYIDCNTVLFFPSIISSYSAEPNKFKQKTKIQFATAGKARIKVEIYNNLGMLRRTLTDKTYDTGKFDVAWDGKNSSKKVFKFATKGDYKARLTVFDKKGHIAEILPDLNLKKTEWRP